MRSEDGGAQSPPLDGTQPHRFLTEDPLGVLGGPNLHVYVRSAPTVWRDALGLEAECSDSLLCFSFLRLDIVLLDTLAVGASLLGLGAALTALSATAAFLGLTAGLFALLSFGLTMTNGGSGFDLGIRLTNLILPGAVFVGVGLVLGAPVALAPSLAVAVIVGLWQTSYDIGGTISGYAELLGGD